MIIVVYLHGGGRGLSLNFNIGHPYITMHYFKMYMYHAGA